MLKVGNWTQEPTQPARLEPDTLDTCQHFTFYTPEHPQATRPATRRKPKNRLQAREGIGLPEQACNPP